MDTVSRLSAICFCILLGSHAFSQQVWTYKTNQLKGTQLFSEGGYAEPYTDSFTLTFTLEHALAANLINTQVEVTDFEAGGLFGLNPPGAVSSGDKLTNGYATLIVSTDAQGQIVDWNFTAYASWAIPTAQGGGYDTFQLSSATVDVYYHLSVGFGNAITEQVGGSRGTWTTPSIVNQVKILECSGDHVYATVPPDNAVVSAVSPNANGSPVYCAKPATEPSTWFIKTTTDGGDTWQWGQYTLGDLGLGK